MPNKGHVFASLADRFWAKVNKITGGCWEWTARCDPAGYGRIQQGGRGGTVLYAHRLSYEMHKGPIPAGAEIDHLCRNRRCCNPDHLEAVSHSVNMARGNLPGAVVHRAGRCARGHKLTPENTYYRKDRPGYWNCRVCRNEDRRAARARQREGVHAAGN